MSRWWPRSLFHRNLLLIVALILLGQVANAVLYRQWVLKPRLANAADAMALNLQALQHSLAALPPPQRETFVEAFNARVLQEAEAAGEKDAAGDGLSRLQRAFLAGVASRLAEGGASAPWSLGPNRTVRMRIGLDEKTYWVSLPGLRPAAEFSGAWIAASAASALLAMLGAWLIQRRLNRPLGWLVAAASALGRGERPQMLTAAQPDAPSEIATVSKAFDEMVTSLDRSEQERALMLAGLSHDLRTPLAKMRLATEMMQGRAEPELLASLERNIGGMDRLLSQFLDFTRASQATPEPRVEAELSSLVRDALSLCSPEGVTASLGPTPARALPAQSVARIVINLVTNAQRHGRAPIEVACGGDVASQWLEVRDSGPGIAPHRIEALKQPFARGDEARGGPAGSGLGLAIVDRLARAQGAVFELVPREGGGLVARVRWPVSSRD